MAVAYPDEGVDLDVFYAGILVVFSKVFISCRS